MIRNRFSSQAVVALVAAAMAFGMAACGNETAADPRANVNGTADKQTGPKKPTKLSGPIVLRVSGGIAGVDDEITVNLNGKASLSTRPKKNPFVCKVATETFAAVKDDALTMQQRVASDKALKDLGKRKLGDPVVADAFNYMLKVNGKEYRVGGGQKIPASVQPLIKDMNQIMTSAKAVRDGKQKAGGSALCS